MRPPAMHWATWAATAILAAGCAWEDEAEIHRRYAAIESLGHEHGPTGTGLASQPAGGADELAEGLPESAGLPELLRYAALHSPALESAFARWKAALERVPQVKALPDPRLNYRYFIEEVETRVGPQRQGVEVMQTFPWFGKLELRGDAASEAAKAEWEHYRAARLRLFHEASDAYHEYWYVTQAVSVTEENVQLLNYIEGVLRARYAAAAAGHGDLIRVQVEQGRLADRLRALQKLRQPVAARLNAALGRPARSPLPKIQDHPDPPPPVDDEQLLAWMRRHNPQLRALEHEVARQGRLAELARKEYFPDVTVGAGFIDTPSAVMRPEPSDSGKDPVYVMLSVNLPVWYDKLAAGVREARWQGLSAAYRKADLANALATELELAMYRYHDAGFKIDLYRDALLPKALQAQQVTDAAFRAGQASFSDLIDTQRVLLEFQLALARARADRAQRRAEMEMLVGREIAAGAPSRRDLPATAPAQTTAPATQPAPDRP